MGKTSLAKKFVAHNFPENPVIWLDADDEGKLQDSLNPVRSIDEQKI